MMLVFQVIGRIGSDNVSAPLGGRRLPAIFPKRCNAGGQAVASGLGLPGRWLGGEQCRSVGLQEAVAKRPCPLGDAGWCFSVRRSFSANIHPYGQVHTDKLWGVGNLNLSPGGQPNHLLFF